MRKITVLIVASVFLLCALVGGVSASSNGLAGNDWGVNDVSYRGQAGYVGSEANPHAINDFADLNAIADTNWGAGVYYQQTGDIMLTASKVIGGFIAHYNGNGYKIDGNSQYYFRLTGTSESGNATLSSIRNVHLYRQTGGTLLATIYVTDCIVDNCSLSQAGDACLINFRNRGFAHNVFVYSSSVSGTNVYYDRYISLIGSKASNDAGTQSSCVNCVAIQSSVSGSSAYKYRLTTCNYPINNYASSDCTPTSTSTNANSNYGATITSTQYNSQSWWENTAHYNFDPEYGAWEWDSATQLPKLSHNAKTADVVIRTVADLQSFATRVNAGETTLSAIMANDVDLTGVTWTPIGTSTYAYAGVFDGNGHIIKNIVITSQNLGFFKYINSAKICNLGFDGVSFSGTITASSHIAVIVSKSNSASSEISCCYVVNCDLYTGVSGAGYGEVTSIILSQGDAYVHDCYASDFTLSLNYLGGTLVGYTEGNASIRNVYSIPTSYKTGSTIGAGGIVGTHGAPNKNGGTIQNSVYLGKIWSSGNSASKRIYGDLTYNTARYYFTGSNNYALSSTYATYSGFTPSSSLNGANGADISPTNITQSFFENTLGWDFTNTWYWDSTATWQDKNGVTYYGLPKLQVFNQINAVVLTSPSTSYEGDVITAYVSSNGNQFQWYGAMGEELTVVYCSDQTNYPFNQNGAITVTDGTNYYRYNPTTDVLTPLSVSGGVTWDVVYVLGDGTTMSDPTDNSDGFIQSDGSAYINSKYISNQNYMRLDMRVEAIGTYTTVTNLRYFGSQQGNVLDLTPWGSSDNPFYNLGAGTNYYVTRLESTSLNTIYTMDVVATKNSGSSGGIVSGTYLGNDLSSLSYTGNLESTQENYIFALNYNNGAQYISKGNLYRLKIYSADDVLARNYLPVRIGEQSNGEYALYDKCLSNTVIYKNVGSGSFSGGGTPTPLTYTRYSTSWSPLNGQTTANLSYSQAPVGVNFFKVLVNGYDSTSKFPALVVTVVQTKPIITSFTLITPSEGEYLPLGESVVGNVTATVGAGTLEYQWYSAPPTSEILTVQADIGDPTEDFYGNSFSKIINGNTYITVKASDNNYYYYCPDLDIYESPKTVLQGRWRDVYEMGYVDGALEPMSFESSNSNPMPLTYTHYDVGVWSPIASQTTDTLSYQSPEGNFYYKVIVTANGQSNDSINTYAPFHVITFQPITNNTVLSTSDISTWILAYKYYGNSTMYLGNDLIFNSSLTVPQFNGTFLGQSHTLSGLTSPLFGNLSATVSDLTFKDSIVSTNDYAGILAKSLGTADVSNVVVDNSYVSGNYAGGLAGAVLGADTSVNDCSVTQCTVVGTSSAGGITAVTQSDTDIVNVDVRACDVLATNGKAYGVSP